MRKSDYKVLSDFSNKVNLSVYDMEILLKAIEFYLIVIRQQYHTNLISTEQYDDMYFDLYCLYQVFNYKIVDTVKYNKTGYYKPLEFKLYKRVDNRVKIDNALKRFKIA